MIYRATIEIAFHASCDAEAADSVSAMFSETLNEAEAIIDWQYLPVNGTHSSPVATSLDPSKVYEENEIFNQ